MDGIFHALRGTWSSELVLLRRATKTKEWGTSRDGQRAGGQFSQGSKILDLRHGHFSWREMAGLGPERLKTFGTGSGNAEELKMEPKGILLPWGHP